jgi:very-short-patch-repair endonuclease
MRSDEVISHLLATGGGVTSRRGHPELTGAMDRLVRANQLTALLPGVYAAADSAHDPVVRMRAVMLRHPDAVLLSCGAAQLSYWPEMAVDVVEVAAPQKIRPARGYRFTRRRIPPELMRTRLGFRLTTPALTAIDLAPMTAAESIDLALRRRVVTLAGLYEALRLTPNRVGNVDRRRILVDSRNEPWSAAERRAHRILRRHGLIGWTSNCPVWVAGQLYYLDIAFRARRLAVEIDGRLHEEDGDLFESDRWRQNALVLEGWDVLRFTWAMLRDHPEVVVATIRAALRGRKVTAGCR